MAEVELSIDTTGTVYFQLSLRTLRRLSIVNFMILPNKGDLIKPIVKFK